MAHGVCERLFRLSICCIGFYRLQYLLQTYCRYYQNLLLHGWWFYSRQDFVPPRLSQVDLAESAILIYSAWSKVSGWCNIFRCFRMSLQGILCSGQCSSWQSRLQYMATLQPEQVIELSFPCLDDKRHNDPSPFVVLPVPVVDQDKNKKFVWQETRVRLVRALLASGWSAGGSGLGVGSFSSSSAMALLLMEATSLQSINIPRAFVCVPSIPSPTQ